MGSEVGEGELEEQAPDRPRTWCAVGLHLL
jgi:hypothetical protein